MIYLISLFILIRIYVIINIIFFYKLNNIYKIFILLYFCSGYIFIIFNIFLF